MTDEEKFRIENERKLRKRIMIAIAIHTLFFFNFLPANGIRGFFLVIAFFVIFSIWHEMPKKA